MPVNPGTDLEVGGSFRVDALPSIQVGVVRYCQVLDSIHCGGNVVSTTIGFEFLEDSATTFVERTLSLPVDPAVLSALCTFTFSTEETEQADVFVDRLFAHSSSALFADGFESGDTTAWSRTMQ